MFDTHTQHDARPIWGLVFETPDGEEITAWVLADEEGNGGGWLNLRPDHQEVGK